MSTSTLHIHAHMCTHAHTHTGTRRKTDTEIQIEECWFPILANKFKKKNQFLNIRRHMHKLTWRPSSTGSGELLSDPHGLWSPYWVAVFSVQTDCWHRALILTLAIIPSRLCFPNGRASVLPSMSAHVICLCSPHGNEHNVISALFTRFFP